MMATAAAGAPTTTAAATTNATSSKTQTSGTDDSSEPAPKHSAADPAASALTLLEQALAAALVAMPTPPAGPGAPAAPADSASSSVSSATAGGGGSSAMLNALLAQSLAAGSGTGTGTGTAGSNSAPAGGSATPAAPTATAGAAAAALTAIAHLPTTPHIGLQQGTADSMSLASQVGTGAWTDELGTKLTWMARQGIESASLQLSPEHLGPLQVSISVHDGQASVWFGAAQPDTRAALEQSLPQLRQLFAGQGLTLADAGVSREPPRGQDRQSPGRAGAPATAIAAIGPESPDGHVSNAGGLGLLDTYA